MEAATLKKEKYADILARCAATNHNSQLATIEVGSKGFLGATSIISTIYHCLTPSKQKKHCTMEKDFIKKCIEHSQS